MDFLKNIKKTHIAYIAIAVIIFIAGWLVYPKALASWQLKTFPDTYETRYDRAIAMNGQGLYAGSTKLLQESYSEDKTFRVGQAWFRNLRAVGNAGKAFEIGERVLNDFPSRHDFRVQVAELMLEHGANERAQSLINRGLELYPDNQALQDFVDRTDNLAREGS